MLRTLTAFILSVFLVKAQPAHIVVEANTGKVLSAENSTVQRPVASLTKIATALVAIDWGNSTKIDYETYLVQVPPLVESIPQNGEAQLVTGDILTLRDALHLALLSSDNRAAATIGHHIGAEILNMKAETGDPTTAFVQEMNNLAVSVLARNTLFANPHGLEDPKFPAYSTAAGMAKISIHAMTRNGFSSIVRLPTHTVAITNNEGERTLEITNTNELIGVPGFTGIKTGTTLAAGPCLATAVDREPLIQTMADGTEVTTNRRLIIVVLNSQDRFDKTRKLTVEGWKFFDSWLQDGMPIVNRDREILDTTVPTP